MICGFPADDGGCGSGRQWAERRDTDEKAHETRGASEIHQQLTAWHPRSALLSASSSDLEPQFGGRARGATVSPQWPKCRDVAMFLQMARRAMHEISTVRNKKGNIAVTDCCAWLEPAPVQGSVQG